MEGFRIARAGVARTFQNIRLFGQMSVLENLIVAQHNALMRASGYTVLGVLGVASYRHAEQRGGRARARLAGQDRSDSSAPTGTPPTCPTATSAASRSRAPCAPQPKLLCLDEPAAGLNPRETAELGGLLRRIRDEFGIGVLLIEHDMSVVMGISDHIVVLDYGSKIADGPPAAIRTDANVIKAYLGETEEEELPPEVAADLAGAVHRSDVMLELTAFTPTTATSRRCTASASGSRRGEIVTIIGANGAGKSTLLMTVCGRPKPSGRRDRCSTASASKASSPTRSSAAASRRPPRGGASSPR